MLIHAKASDVDETLYRETTFSQSQGSGLGMERAIWFLVLIRYEHGQIM